MQILVIFDEFLKQNKKVSSIAKSDPWGSRPQTDKHLQQSPFTGQFFSDDDILCITFYESYLSTGRIIQHVCNRHKLSQLLLFFIVKIILFQVFVGSASDGLLQPGDKIGIKKLT